MKDKIEELVNELNKYSNYKFLEKHIKKMLKKQGFIEQKSRIKCGYLNKNSKECTFYCKIDSSHNITNQDMFILVKPDHASKRIMRIVVQAGNIILQKEENKDHWNRNNDKVFKKAELAILKDLNKMLSNLKKAA